MAILPWSGHGATEMRRWRWTGWTCGCCCLLSAGAFRGAERGAGKWGMGAPVRSRRHRVAPAQHHGGERRVEVVWLRHLHSLPYMAGKLLIENGAVNGKPMREMLVRRMVLFLAM